MRRTAAGIPNQDNNYDVRVQTQLNDYDDDDFPPGCRLLYTLLSYMMISNSMFVSILARTHAVPASAAEPASVLHAPIN